MDLNKKEQTLAILTEVLPYEIPLRMNNEAFFDNMLNDKVSSLFNDLVSAQSLSFSKPFNYQVRKYGGEKLRQLSLIHPVVQLQIAKFYSNYSELMLYFSQRSPFSLRHIESVAHQNVQPPEGIELKTTDTVVEVDQSDGTQDESYKSFFTYKDCDFAFRFFEGFPFVKLEQKFKYVRYLDVSNCFYNIYTHSFCWAIKGKDDSKKHANKSSFESKFDKLMQIANYNETDGIVVGPEVSRIFAEIILQRIDVEIINTTQKIPLKLGIDYEIRRYVDDFMVFANKEENLELIEKAISRELLSYKLYLNESKKVTVSRPFLTKETKAKIEIKELFSQFVEKYFSETDGTKKRINVDRITLKIIHSFSIIAESNNVNYGVINRVLLSSIKGFLAKCKSDSVRERNVDVFIVLAELSFFTFNLDMCASSSLKLASILYRLKDLLSTNCAYLLKLKERIIRHLKSTLDVYLNTQMGKETNLEIQNILITVCDVWDYLPQEDLLRTLFHADCKEFEPDYFQVCSLLYLIKDNPDYAKLSSDLQKAVLNRFSEQKEQIKIDTELTYLFFDYMSCPWIPDKQKEKVLSEYCRGNNDPAAEVARLKLVKRWFFDWDSNHNIREFLKKKEYSYS